jgi:peptide chain release factor 1
LQFIAKWLLENIFDIALIEERSGIIIFKVTGNQVNKYFENENGGHRFQRHSPTEKNDRIHTSTITVAVLEDFQTQKVEIDERDLKWEYTKGQGAGGQHKNKTESKVVLTHIPTGIKVSIDGRKREQNRQEAFRELTRRLNNHSYNSKSAERNLSRKSQVGCGMRGDKRRTIRFQDDTVIDHILGKSCTLKKYLKGDLSKLR